MRVLALRARARVQDGLRVCVMPLGEMVGSRLPMKYPLPVVLTVAGCLGILVTYAEPAIASLAPLAQRVDKQKVGGRSSSGTRLPHHSKHQACRCLPDPSLGSQPRTPGGPI